MDITMSKFQCKTCLGIYNDTCPDGLAYYHACPDKLEGNDKYKPRKDKRDENPGRKSEGKGRVKLEE